MFFFVEKVHVRNAFVIYLELYEAARLEQKKISAIWLKCPEDEYVFIIFENLVNLFFLCSLKFGNKKIAMELIIIMFHILLSLLHTIRQHYFIMINSIIVSKISCSYLFIVDLHQNELSVYWQSQEMHASKSVDCTHPKE